MTVTAGPDDLLTLDLANSYLGLTSDNGGLQDTRVQTLISSKSEQVKAYLGYFPGQRSYTKTFNGIFGDRFMMPDRPITMVSALSIDNQSYVKASGGAPGFLWDDVSVYFIGLGRTCGRQNVVMSYTAGYSPVPADIVDGCLQLIQVGWTNVDGEIPANVSRYQAGDTSLTFGDATTKASAQKSSDLIPPAIAALLRPYRRVY